MLAPDAFLAPLRTLHDRIRDAVVEATEAQSIEQLTQVATTTAADTIYHIDRISEDLLVELLNETVAALEPILLIAEGVAEEGLVLPRDSDPSAVRWRLIVDPIDGTRGLMYQKRSAWILSGLAPNRGPDTRLSDIVLAVQTEIPLVKQHLSDQLWALRGGGAQALRFNRLTRTTTPLPVRPSQATTLAHGFGSITRFFPGGRDLLAAVDDRLAHRSLGNTTDGHSIVYEDQYIASGGQLYELMVGHDRFIADLRPLLAPLLREQGQPTPICSHPYDLCTALIAQEAGVVLSDPLGAPLDAPLDTHTDVGWIGYANAPLRAHLEPHLFEAMRKFGLGPRS